MADTAHKKTDKYIDEIEYRLRKEYEKAEKEVAEKAKKHFERFEAKDKVMRERLERKEITMKEYKKWRTNQMLVGKRWNNMRDTLAQDFANTNSIARSITSGYMPEVYALNHNFGTYEIEKGARVDTSYTLYSRETVEALMRDNPQLLPDPGKTLDHRIYNGLDVRYNRQQLQSVAMQAVLQGESIPKIAARLAREVGEKNHKAAVRNARTMMTCAQNKGRIDSYKRAEKMGIDTNKRWLSTHDGRTRHWHSDLDEVSVPVDEPFVNDYGEIDYPGDPSADPANVYNCRCTLVADIKHVMNVSERLEKAGVTNKRGDMSYEEWLKDHREKEKTHMPPSYLGRIDYSDKALVRKTLDRYERGLDRLDIEEAVVVTRSGKVYRCYGTRDGVQLEDDLGRRLYGASMTHNHPKESPKNEYSFGPSDLELFDKFKVEYMGGIDESFKYRMSRLDSKVDKEPREMILLAYADPGKHFRHAQMIGKAKERGIGYTREVNDNHKRTKRKGKE